MVTPRNRIASLIILFILLVNPELGIGQASSEVEFSGGKESLGSSINTEYDETHPVISPDGSTLYFVRQDYPGNIGGKSDKQDIFFSVNKDKKWVEAENIGEPLNDANPNGVFSISPDMKSLLLINEYLEEGDKAAGASFTTRGESGWNFPERIEIENFMIRGKFIDFFISNSGNAVIIAGELPGTIGDQDLYVSFRTEEDTWETPINLGPVINTKKAEFSPFLGADNKILFFATIGHGGYGKSDLFYSKRLDDTWQNWSEPVNLGAKINTKGDDAYFTMSTKGDYAYFVSDQGTLEDSKDIFRIRLPQEIKSEPVILVAGRIFNKSNKLPIGASIRFRSNETGKDIGITRSDPFNGVFKMVLPKNGTYNFRVESGGYIPIERTINAKNISRLGEYREYIYLMPMEIGKFSVMDNVFFDYKSPVLLPESYPELKRISKFLQENPLVSIELAGHTNNQGKADTNQQLSQERVDTIIAFLVKEGVDPSRISGKGYGISQARARSRFQTQATLKINERIELKVLTN